MKILLTFIAISISATLFAQTKRKTKDTANLKTVFYVLKSDQNIKDGPYKEYDVNFNDRLICEGFYKQNQRDSLWTCFGFGGSDRVAETGYYKNGRKYGIWKACNLKGEPEIQYDYTAKKLLLCKASGDTSIKQRVINGADTVLTRLDRRAIYLDGSARFYGYLIRDIRYPAIARENGVQGKVLIAFTVDTLGRVAHYRIAKRVGGGCDEEALRVVKLIEGDWLPAMLNGKPVNVECLMPISFTLSAR